MRVLAALSGGVDSAVAAARLLHGGAEVAAVHVRTGVEVDEVAAGGARSCCGLDDARDARRVAAHLGLPFYVVDASVAFRRVLGEFEEAYAEGRTANPCVTCNATVKFGHLARVAAELGCDAVGTGHYARTVAGPSGRVRLLRALDEGKDQSYVLYRLDQTQLARARFPLGESRKAAVREEARALGLRVADKPDSQDLCFLPPGGVAAYLKARARGTLRPGPFVDPDGRVVGRHDGETAFTHGQRRGLPPLGSPHYVSSIDPGTGRVTVAPRDHLLRRTVDAEDDVWIDEPRPSPGRRFRVQARIRHAAPLRGGWLEVTDPGIRVVFDEAVFAPTPGQALVAYRGEAVLAGGTISTAPSGARPRTAHRHA